MFGLWGRSYLDFGVGHITFRMLQIWSGSQKSCKSRQGATALATTGKAGNSGNLQARRNCTGNYRQGWQPTGPCLEVSSTLLRRVTLQFMASCHLLRTVALRVSLSLFLSVCLSLYLSHKQKLSCREEVSLEGGKYLSSYAYRFLGQTRSSNIALASCTQRISDRLFRCLGDNIR